MPQTGENYRHYKSSGGENYTYKIIFVALHKETNEELVIYKTLYQTEEYTIFARPLSMREEQVEYKEKLVTRFTKI